MMNFDPYISLNLLNLMKTTTNSINQDLAQLSSGNQINYAADNPTGLELMSRFNSYSDSNTISNDNIDKGTAFFDSANSVLSQVLDTLTSIRQLIVTNSDSSLSADQKATNQALIASKLDDIDNLVKNTYYNNMKVFDTTADNVSSNTFSSSNTGVANTDTLYLNSNWSHTLNVSQLAQAEQVSSDAQSSSTTALGLNGSFSLNGTTFNVTSDMSLTDISNLINGATVGVTASISSNKLLLTSNDTGASSTIAASDFSSIAGSQSTDPSVATVSSVTSNTNWSENVNVTQLAGSKTDYFNDFSSTDMSTIDQGGGNTWSISGGTITVTNATTGGNAMEIVGSSNYSVNRTTSVDMNLTNKDSGIAFAQTSSGDFYTAHISTSGTLTIDSFGNNPWVGKTYGINLNGNTQVNMAVTTDSSNNVTVTIKDLSGNVLGTVNDNLNTITGRTVDLTGTGTGLYMTGTGSNSFDNLKVTENAKATYTVNGTQYTSDSNTNVSLIDPSTGTELAKINLNGLGTTTISNSTGGGNILQTLGVLKSDGTFKNTIQTGQDANYSIDGNNYTSSVNNDIMIQSGGKDYASVDLTGVGTTTISNTATIGPSSDPTSLKLHMSWKPTDASTFALSKISTGQLGISSLRTDTTNGLQLIDAATEQVTMEQQRLGTIHDILSTQKDLNSKVNNQFTDVTSRINDIDSAKIQSEIAKMQIQQQKSDRSHVVL